MTFQELFSRIRYKMSIRISLGLTDTSIIEVAAEPYLVFTTDYPLASRLQHRGMAALNYNNFRPTILGF